MVLVAALPVLAQQRSAKRGMSWDEKSQRLSSAPVEKMAPGVAWVYTWGATPQSAPDNLGPGKAMEFVPMCWNASFDEAALRTYLTANPGVRYLLAFNEPNLSVGVGGSQMTPQQAATAWPRLEQVAQDFGLEIVAPALNFTGDKVGDRVWEPFAWYDEFFRLCPTARVDYLAFHSYMNYAEAVDWVTSRYFYTDKEDDDLYAAANQSRYPNLVKYLNDYREAHGHFPRMFLTEFCSWSASDYPYRAGITRDFQIDQMTQKLQYLEKSDLVAGYAWFMANPSGGEGEFPYMSIFRSNTAASELSDLGKVYVYMSSFDTTRWYAPGEDILAKDYVDASMDNLQARVRPNTEEGSDIPLQVELQASAWTTYQLDIPTAGDYQLVMHVKTTADNTLGLYGDGFKRLAMVSIPTTAGAWADRSVTLSLPAGHSVLTLFNAVSPDVCINALRLESPSGIQHVTPTSTPHRTYTLTGTEVTGRELPRGIYIRDGRKFMVP